MPRATSTQLEQGLLQATPAVEQSVEVAHATGAPPAQMSGGQPPAHGEVQDWFAAQHLSAYGPPAVALGYDKLVFLRGMDEAEVAGLIQKLQMPVPHARAFRAALAGLVPQATAAPGGAPVPGVVASVAVPVTPAPVPVMAQPAQHVQVVQQPRPVVNQTTSGNSAAKAGGGCSIFVCAFIGWMVIDQINDAVDCDANQQCCTTGGGTVTIVDANGDPIGTCSNCGPTPCMSTDNTCWSCAAVDGKCHRYDCGTTCSDEPCQNADAQSLSMKAAVSAPWSLTPPPPPPPAPVIDPGWPSTSHEASFSA